MTAQKTTSVANKAETRRTQVLEAAADCFRREGFHGCSIARISQAAGMSPGHIYHYFANKEAIVAAIVECEESEAFELMEQTESAGKQTDLVEAITDQLGEILDRRIDANRSALMLEILAEAARNPQIARLIQRSDEVVRKKSRKLLADAIAIGGGTADDAEIDARSELVAALFEGLAIRALRNPWLDKVAIARLLGDTIRHIVLK